MMFKKKLRKALKSSPTLSETQYCCVINKDDMLFFPSKRNLIDYVSEYEKRVPIYNLSLFKVVFESLI